MCIHEISRLLRRADIVGTSIGEPFFKKKRGGNYEL
jgi:hypothetical protein